MTKERPILMSGPMVRAILEGRKTQTRRVGALQSAEYVELAVERVTHAAKGSVLLATYAAFPGRGTARWGICECPYGLPVDRLWVRETFCDIAHEGYQPVYFYRADGADKPEWVKHWKPSIFMPRAASRITLEIVSVRVERLQDISEADALAEGIHRFEMNDCEYFHWRKTAATEEHFTSAVMAYRDLWQNINGPESWALNPWVWVVEFKRLEVGA